MQAGWIARAEICLEKAAKRVIAVDQVDYRLEHAKTYSHVEAYNFGAVNDLDKQLIELTKGGADVVIDCVAWMRSAPRSKRSKRR